MTYLLQQLLDGLSIGTAYALAAIGFTLIFGIMRVLNMAQKLMIMIGPMVAVAMMQAGITNLWMLLPVAALAAAVAGLLVERIALRPFVDLLRVTRSSDSDHLAPFVATLALVVAGEHLAARIVGTRAMSFRIPQTSGSWNVLGVYVGRGSLVALAVGALLIIALVLVLQRSSMGLVMRATADNPAAASFSGVNIVWVLAGSTALAAALGGVAGVLIGGMDSVVSVFMGFRYGVKALVVMIVGGAGSVWGAVAAGLLLGTTEALTVGYLSSNFRDFIAFGLLFIVLLVRPNGLFTPASAAA